MIELIFILLCGHALADFALQGDAMAKGKNRHNKPKFIPKGQKLTPCWFYWLTAHALIHGIMVIFLLRWRYCGLYISNDAYPFILIIAGLHWAIDFAKCEDWTNPHTDQLLHLITITGIAVYFICF